MNRNVKASSPFSVPILKIMDGRSNPIQEKFYEVGSVIELQCVAASLPVQVLPKWFKSGVELSPGTQISTNVTEAEQR